MGERDDFLEEKKKLKKAKRKAIRPWKGLTFLSLPLALISIAALIAATIFDNTVAIFFGGTFWELENTSDAAEYFTTDYEEWEDNEEYGRRIAEQVEAEGAALFSKADVAIATTGIAGPDGGSEQKPVGLVYIACNVKGNVTVKECHFSGNRMKIRETTVANALILMRECILEYGKKKEYENGDKY